MNERNPHYNSAFQAIRIAVDLSRTRVLMYEQSGSSIAFGLFAPANATVLATLSVGVLSVAGAIFLILELYDPYAGLMFLSSARLRSAPAQIGP